MEPFRCCLVAPTYVCTRLLQSCHTFCNPMDCSLSVSPVHSVFQARILDWDAISFSRGSAPPTDRTRAFPASPALAGGSLPLSHLGKLGRQRMGLGLSYVVTHQALLSTGSYWVTHVGLFTLWLTKSKVWKLKSIKLMNIWRLTPDSLIITVNGELNIFYTQKYCEDWMR